MKINKNDLEMVDDVYGAMLIQTPSVHRYIIWSLVSLFFCFFIWAYFAKLDRITRGEGKVIPSAHVQIIQSLDGGVLQKIYVKEGMKVSKGQVLASIDDTRFRSDLAQQDREIDTLRANIIRLKSELSSILVVDKKKWQDQIKIDKRLLVFPIDLVGKAPTLIKRQQEEYNGGINKLVNKIAIQAQQIKQREQDVKELNSKIYTLQVSLKIANRELKLTRPLAEKNIVPLVELLKLERNVNDIGGGLRTLRILKPKVNAALKEAVLKRREAVLKYRSERRAKLNELQSVFSKIKEAQVGVKDRVTKALIISPVIGTIKTIHIRTIGGVVKPGDVLLEIVPTEDELLIEAKILPKDIAFIHVGLRARVKVTAYDFTRYGGLEGVVEHISADTTQDKEGNSFYIIRVRTNDATIGEGDKEKEMHIMPGMLTTVDVIIGKRSVLDYILNPILRAREVAFREH